MALGNIKSSEEPDISGLTESDGKEEDCSSLRSELKKIITCTLCLEIIQDPRKLPCQHFFCYQCLKECFRACSNFTCPICRRDVEEHVDNLPRGLIENQLIDLVNDDKLDDSEMIEEKKTSLDKISSTEILSRSPAQNMSEKSIYKVSRQSDEYNINELLKKVEIENNKFEIILFEINTVDNYQNSLQLVLVDQNYQFIVRFKSEIYVFHVFLEDGIIKPEFLKIHEGNLIISGQLTKDQYTWLIVKCNEKGEVLAKSNLYLCTNTTNVSMICGFDFNENEKVYYVCLPGKKKVATLDCSLSESTTFHFHHIQPQYAAFSNTTNQLWLSCPTNRQIIILDLGSGYYRTINTFEMIPTVISVKEDNIICLDSKRHVLVWIKKTIDDISNQDLITPSGVGITLFQTISLSKIVICNGKKIIYLEKDIGLGNLFRFLNYCKIL